MIDQLKTERITFTGPAGKFVKKNIGVQCFLVYFKLWPNFDPNLRCLKLINMAIIRTKYVGVF